MQTDFLKEEVKKRLSEKRFRHVMGCVEEAKKLAKRWRVDEDKAESAALLHDITKEISKDAQLNLCRKYDEMPDWVTKNAYPLMHAFTGYLVAREEFGMDKEICNAIRYHTTGRKKMTQLEKIIYLADFIEPTRTFPGVEIFRKGAYEDLDGTLMLTLDFSIREVLDYGGLLHINTVEARNNLRMKDKEVKNEVKRK